MRKSIEFILLWSVFIVVGCGELDKPKSEKVIGGEVMINLDAKTWKTLLIEQGLSDINSTVYGYKGYKIPYVTTNEEGEEVNASGLMSVPLGLGEVVESQLGFSVVSDDHGTIFAEIESPTTASNLTNIPSGSSVILTSFAGFVTLQPDYIGFGDSASHYHPFILKKSLANATIDFIKAARKFAKNNNIKLNNQLFLTGYSEGGYGALATLEKIESDNSIDLNITMSTPMAGPYALETMGMGVLAQEQLSVPSFMANVGFAYAKAYHQDIKTIINEPYVSNIENLFSGEFVRTAIDLQLTTKTAGEDALFDASFVTEVLTDDRQWFRVALQENDVSKWVPQSPVRFVHCLGDDVIPYGISELTEGTMKQLGAEDVALVPVETTLGLDKEYSHTKCADKAYGLTATLFATKRKEEIGY